MHETWTQWKPIEGLSHGYYIDAINDNFDGFSIWLGEDKDRTRGVMVTFSNSVSAYRVVDEGCRLKTISMLDTQYGGDFYTRWSFFKVENSEYLQWLSQESFTLTDMRSVKHLAFISQNSIVDVAVSYEPNVELVVDINKYKK